MFRNNLKLKVSLYLILAMSPALVLLPFLIVRNQQTYLQQEIARHVTQIAEVIVKSTRYAMLLNQREIAEKIIEDVGRQAGIERVRVLTKDGTIIHSKRRSETGFSVNQRTSPACAVTRPASRWSGFPTTSAGASTRTPTAGACWRRWSRSAMNRRARTHRATSTRRTSRCWAWSTSPIRSTRSTRRCARHALFIFAISVRHDPAAGDRRRRPAQAPDLCAAEGPGTPARSGSPTVTWITRSRCAARTNSATSRTRSTR
jgi:hypothetical protein